MIFTDPPVDGGPPNGGSFVIGVAAGYVYWAAPLDVPNSRFAFRRGRVDGSGAPEELTQTTSIFAAAVDATALYYVFGGDAVIAAKGTSPRPLGQLPVRSWGGLRGWRSAPIVSTSPTATRA